MRPGRRWPGFFACTLWPALLAIGAQAAAQTGDASPTSMASNGTRIHATGDYLARMDTDRDGRVSLAEYRDWMSYAFDAMDRNRDHALSADELPGGKGQPLTRADYHTRLAATFDRQDRNRDGYLSAKELAAPPQ